MSSLDPPSRSAQSERGRRLESEMHRQAVSVDFEVPFHDVDALQIVWHGHYYKYFELARTALLRSLKLDGPDLQGLGHGLLVIETHCRHSGVLGYGDQARVTAWLADTLHRIHVRYEIRNRTRGIRAARGHTIMVTTSAAGEMLLRTPEAVQRRLALPTGLPHAD